MSCQWSLWEYENTGQLTQTQYRLIVLMSERWFYHVIRKDGLCEGFLFPMSAAPELMSGLQSGFIRDPIYWCKYGSIADSQWRKWKNLLFLFVTYICLSTVTILTKWWKSPKWNWIFLKMMDKNEHCNNSIEFENERSLCLRKKHFQTCKLKVIHDT